MSLLLLNLPGDGPQTATLETPDDPILAGFPLAMQLLDGNALSRSTFTVQMGV